MGSAVRASTPIFDARHSVTKSVNIFARPRQQERKRQLEHTDLDGVKRTAGALGVELDAPDLLARVRGGLDALDRRVVAVDEERLPALGEGVLKRERVLMVLTTPRQPSDSRSGQSRAYLVT
jgi:hypothetical protein